MVTLRKKPIDKRTFILVVCVVLFVLSGGLILYMRHTQSVNATNKDLASRPVAVQKTSTKLYFKDQASLPKTYTPGQQLSMTFVIQNHEGKTMTYPFEVLVNGTQVASHTLTVKDKTDQNVDQSFSLPTGQQKLLIEVKLTNPAQTISFSLDRA